MHQTSEAGIEVWCVCFIEQKNLIKWEEKIYETQSGAMSRVSTK